MADDISIQSFDPNTIATWNMDKVITNRGGNPSSRAVVQCATDIFEMNGAIEICDSGGGEVEVIIFNQHIGKLSGGLTGKSARNLNTR